MQRERIYPGFFEKWWVDRTLKRLSCESLAEREAQLTQSVQALSDRFTLERQSLQADYFADEQSLCAYGLFFFPQSFVRTALVLREILARGWNAGGPLSVLDLGSGAGAASFSAASLLHDRPVHLTAIDHSPNALSAMQELARDGLSQWPLLECRTEVADIRRWMRSQGRQWDLVLASLTLNEIEFSPEQQTGALRNLLTDRGVVVVIEPALKSASEKLEEWRDQISLRDDLRIWAPCLHHRACPLLKESRGRFWCHEVRSWHAPDSLAFLNRHLYRRTHVLKFSFLVFGKQGPVPLDSFAFRLISPVSRQKKSLLFTGCTAGGRKKDFRVPGTLIEDERKSIKEWERGDIVTSFSLNDDWLS